MPVWYLTIDLSDLVARWNSGDLDDGIVGLAKAVTARIKESRWRSITADPLTFDTLMHDLERVTTDAEYMGEFEGIYDLADGDRVWITTS
jgi:hypothetical protein